MEFALCLQSTAIIYSSENIEHVVNVVLRPDPLYISEERFLLWVCLALTISDHGDLEEERPWQVT